MKSPGYQKYLLRGDFLNRSPQKQASEITITPWAYNKVKLTFLFSQKYSDLFIHL